jgi:hypothetical protein
MVTALWTLAGAILGTLFLYVTIDSVLRKHGDPRLSQRVRRLEQAHRQQERRLEKVEGVLRLWPTLRP